QLPNTCRKDSSATLSESAPARGYDSSPETAMYTNSHPQVSTPPASMTPVSMIDLSRHQSLGSALGEAVDRFADEICLIEADRERENHRLTYREFKEATLPLARFLQDCDFKAGSRAAIIMTNQSCWLIAAYAVFYSGGVLIPLDYKLSA